MCFDWKSVIILTKLSLLNNLPLSLCIIKNTDTVKCILKAFLLLNLPVVLFMCFYVDFYCIGTLNGLMVIIPIGGQVHPVSVEGVSLLWKNVQNKAEKKQISLVINRSTAPLYFRTLWRYTNCIIIIIIVVWLVSSVVSHLCQMLLLFLLKTWGYCLDRAYPWWDGQAELYGVEMICVTLAEGSSEGPLVQVNAEHTASSDPWVGRVLRLWDWELRWRTKQECRRNCSPVSLCTVFTVQIEKHQFSVFFYISLEDVYLTLPYLWGGQVVTPAQCWGRISSAQCAAPM